MNIVFACGGTGGHINPALAVAGLIHQKHPDVGIYFIGNETGMEARLVPKAGFSFYPIHVQGFRRKLSLKGMAHNVKAVWRAVTASAAAGRILKQLSPQLVVGMGGYVSGPVLRKAHQMGIKTATHEQNAFPGVTTKMLSKYVDVVMLAMPEARRFLPQDRTYVTTGNPVRSSLAHMSRTQAREKLKLDERPMILSFGGSLGAKRLNEAVADLIAAHANTREFYHFHATGSYGYEWMPQLLREKGVDPKQYDQLRISEYIDDMDLCMAAADLVIGRAGAITLSEIEVQGKPSILIPSPNVAENHQYHNAMTLVQKGAAVIIEEKDLTSQKLIAETFSLLHDPERLHTMGRAAKAMAIADSAQRIYEVLWELIEK